jgi:uncharacterized protein YaeQ
MHKYTLSITCNGEPRKLVFTRASQESERHLALKLLAYLLYFELEPKVEFGVGQHYKPDLVCMSGRDVSLWVDCGDIGFHKLDKVATRNHRARVIVVKATARSAVAYQREAMRRIRRPERIAYAGFDEDFVEGIVYSLSTRTSLTATISEDRFRLQITINDRFMETRVHWS